MPLSVVVVPCLTDNYAFLLHDDVSGATALIDIPEALPIQRVLMARGWTLSEIWITHHHDDHVQGLGALLDKQPDLPVIGAAADAHRLPPLTRAVADGDTFEFAGSAVQVIDVSGHTMGHVAFYVADAGAAFTADSLMALGCGRLFEGDGATMWASLSKLAALPPNTLICSGHEYTTANAAFALSIEPDNPELIARAADVTQDRAMLLPTVPSRLATELATNPFLRAHLPEVKAHLSMTGRSDAEVFTEIRSRKDMFKG